MSLPLLHSPADILRRVIIALGAGGDPDLASQWPVYATNEPSMPDNVITVIDTTPQYDMRAMVDGSTSFHYGYQVRVRAADHPQGQHRIDLIRVALDEQLYDMALTIDAQSYIVYNVAKSGGVLYIGKDTPNSKRSLFTLNGLVVLKRADQPD